MGKLLPWIVGAVAVLAGWLTYTNPGHTADIATKAPPQAVTAWPSWAGFYGGVSAGYGWNRSGATVSDGSTSIVLGDSPSGMTGGARLGYDWQVGKLVVGVETDAALSGFDSSTGLSGLSIQNASHWWGSTNARVGLSAFGDHWLPYVIGGIAYGGAKTAFQAPSLTAAVSEVKTGWDLGGGLEVRITPNLSAFAEYRYLNTGSVTLPVISTMTVNQPLGTGVAWGGLNYRF